MFASAALSAPKMQAQDHASMEPGTVLISIYHIAPGQHLAFLKWIAAREEVAHDLGQPTSHFFAHQDGASWDYLAIGPATTEEQDKAADDLATERGLTTGFPASIEFRQYVASHTDTYALGPISAADLVRRAEGRH